MKNFFCSFILILFSCSIFSQDNTVGTISIDNDVYDGYTLFSSNLNTFLINNCGQVVNQWTSQYLPGHSVYILPNGNLIRAGRKDTSSIVFGGVGGIVEMFDWDGNLVWEFEYSDDNNRMHHDIYPMPNGNILVLVASVMSNEEAILAGRDPDKLGREPDHPDGVLYNEQILEIKPVGSDQYTLEWEWNFKDHLIQDFDNSKNNFGVVEDHPEKLDVNFLNGRDPAANWLHVNSIQYDETLDQIVISSRNLSEVYIIDHSTTIEQAATGTGGIYGKGGDFLYRWGNPDAYRRGNSTNRTLYGQHFPHYIKPGLKNAGKIIVFNNGANRQPVFSDVLIFTPPTSSPGFYNYTSGTAYGPENVDFDYASTEDNNFTSGILSGAIMLPNDNILICDGNSGRFVEINSSNEVVWNYIIPMNNSTGEITSQGNIPNGNSTFRGIKYSKSYEGIVGKDLTPGDPIETNFNLNPCTALSTDEVALNNFRIYPIPVKNELNLNINQDIIGIEIFNILGKKLNHIQIDNNKVNLSQVKSGVYILKVQTNKGVFAKKFVKN